MSEMMAVKRSGAVEPLCVEKIQKVTAFATYGLKASASEVELKAHIMFFDGIRTDQIHQSLIRSAAELISEESPDYSFVAARLLLQTIYKDVTCGKVIYPSLASYIERATGEGRLDQRMLTHFDMSYLEAHLDYTRDYDFGYLGLQTLCDRYLIRRDPRRDQQAGDLIEMPQHFWMRVAMGLALNEKPDDRNKWAVRFYNLLSQFKFVSSTPTLFNAGTTHAQMSSCYLNSVSDEIGTLGGESGIFNTITECANLSKWAGGIGTDWTNVRPAGDVIGGTGGKSSGIIPYLKIFNDTAVAVNQGGKRNGAFAAYLEPWHGDIMRFIDIKKNAGDEHLRAREIFTAMWMNDLFFDRLAEDGDWSLFSPKDCPELHDSYGAEFKMHYERYEAEGKAIRVMKAQELWRAALGALFESGGPWITFKDECNRRNPQSHVGAIRNSNLCVAPETLILTDKGHQVISDIAGQRANVWNGEEYSEVDIVKTGVNQKLIKVILSNGSEIECTPYHKFYIQDNYWSNTPTEKRAHELVSGDKLIKFDLPVIEGEFEFDHAYTAGFFCGDGTYNRGKPVLHLYGEKRDLVDYLEIKSGSGVEQADGRLSYCMVDTLPDKFTVPHGYSIRSRLSWFAGLLDADGTVARNGKNQSLQIASINRDFLIETQRMLQTLGVSAKVSLMREASSVKFAHDVSTYETQPLYRILVASTDVQGLMRMGLKTNRLKLINHTPNRAAHGYITVVSVIDEGRIDDTYCFSEPKRHMGVFNGILTGQCTEITEVANDDETAVCNLGSVNLSRVGPSEFSSVIPVAIRMLDNVIDLNFYPSIKAYRSNMRHRPIGLGVMGWTELVVSKGIDWESEAHLQFTNEVFEQLSFWAIYGSMKLARERGAYSSFEGSKWSQVLLPIDTARALPADWTPPLRCAWDSLREDVKEHGVRNSNIMAIAPTATISNIVGTTPCIEPTFKHVFTKENHSGVFNVVDPALKYGRKDLCKTAFEIDQMWVIRAAAVRQQWIDQSQSVNLFAKQGTTGKDLEKWYLAAHRLGLKTTYYLKRQIQELDHKSPVMDVKMETVLVDASEEDLIAMGEAKMCSIENPDCESCQ